MPYANGTATTETLPALLNHRIPISLPALPPIWSILLLLLLAFNLKNIPLVWHFRIVNALSSVLPSQRAYTGQDAPTIFDAVVTESHSPVMEIDFNLHKSNSTYFSDLDIARAHLTCTLFSRGIEAARFAAYDHIIGGGNKPFGALLGGASCAFKHEIKPYQRYLMWSRVLCWNEKWFWIVTWFVEANEKGSQDAEKKVFATGLSKCVFKKGRKTVKPEIIMKLSGLLPGHVGADDGAQSQHDENVASIELERRRGLECVDSQDGLEKLHDRFTPTASVLARKRGMDSSPFLAPKIIYLFGEWLGGRIGRLFSGSK